MSFEAKRWLRHNGWTEGSVQQVLSPLLCEVEISLALAGETDALVEVMGLDQIPVTKSEPEPGYHRWSSS
jgi:hypothetical protein